MPSAGIVWRIVPGVAAIIVSFTGAAQTSESQSSLVEANPRFSFKLFHQLVSQTPDKNILVSPTGLSLTFALLDNGADPATGEEIDRAFEFKDFDLAEINE